MMLKEIIGSIEAGDGLEAWEKLRVWYRRFYIFACKYPEFFRGRRRKLWDEIHDMPHVCEARKDVILGRVIDA